MDLLSSNLSPISISVKQPSSLCLRSWNDSLENSGLTIFDVAINQGVSKVSVNCKFIAYFFLELLYLSFCLIQTFN